VRENDPSAGKLDLPGGFADPGEGILETARRECREELQWDPGDALRLFCSEPNVYNYKNISYNTCDAVFTVDAPDLTLDSFVKQDAEIRSVRIIAARELNMEDIAFPSIRKALAKYLRMASEGRVSA
jgi:8-oxo-dGTP pyrophosphatase MutT (NUDIX family)